jgi:hypothetical protein
MNDVIQRVITPIDDAKIKRYLGNDTRIIKYSDLSKYDDIEQLLPSNKSFFILLIESDNNYGHWVSVSRLNNVIQYFDSYGLYPSSPLQWNTKEKNDKLGQSHKYLNKLFDKTHLEVVYNGYDFQGKNADISTCGRHQLTYLLLMKEKNMSLKDYINFIKQQKINPDILISKVII